MSRIFLLMRKTFGDFDIPLYEPIGFSEDEEYVKAQAIKWNAERSKEELRNEVSYEMQKVKSL